MVDFASNHFNLDQFQWENRLILFFLTDSSLEMIQEEVSNVAEEIIDREIRVIYFTEKGGVMLGDSIIIDSHAGEWYKEFSIKPGNLTLVLIGKDGSEKYRAQPPFRFQEIFDLIDTMPMRRREMRWKE